MEHRLIVKGEEVHIARTSAASMYTLRAEFTVIVAPSGAAEWLAELTRTIMNEEGCWLGRAEPT